MYLFVVEMGFSYVAQAECNGYSRCHHSALQLWTPGFKQSSWLSLPSMWDHRLVTSVPGYFFQVALLGSNCHTVNCTYVKCTAWSVWHTYRPMNLSSWAEEWTCPLAPKVYSICLCNPSFPPHPQSWAPINQLSVIINWLVLQ